MRLQSNTQNNNLIYNISLFVGIVLVSILARLVLLKSYLNFLSPVIAICVFSNAYFKRKGLGLLLSLAITMISDIAINVLTYKSVYGLFYQGWYYFYAVYAVIGLLAIFINNSKKLAIEKLIVSSVISVLIWWAAVDFMVWYFGGINISTNSPLSKDINGLYTAYSQGFIFAAKQLISALVFTTLFYIGYSITSKKFTVSPLAA